MASNLVFLDDAGGALSALAGAIARALGQPAIATTTGSVRPLPPEIPAVLAEVGYGAPASVETYDPGAHTGRVVHLGPAAPKGGAEHWPVQLYDGPPETDFGDADLERNAWARTSRDRIEKALASSRSGT